MPTTPPHSPARPSADPAWTSTRSAAEISAALRAARRVLVLTHARPDGDALGASLALVRSLVRIGVDARAAYVPAMPRWAGQVIAGTPYTLLEADHVARLEALREPERIVVVDTGAWMQLEEVRSYIAARTGKVIVIDHHLSGNPDLSSERLLDPAAAAVAEVVAPVCCGLLGVPGPGHLSPEVATPLYLGLATDTGWFRYSNTRPATLRLAADLLAAGVNHSELFEWVEQQDRPARLSLQARALASLVYYDGQAIAVMSLSRADFDSSHADTEDAGGFAADCLRVAEIQVCVVLTEMVGKDPAKPITKASLRSKPGPHALDVAAVCAGLGGGGHARAAGVKLALPLAAAQERIVATIRAARSG